MRIKSSVDLEKLRQFDFEQGEDSEYERYFIRVFKNTSWSLVIEKNREIVIISTTIDEYENIKTKKITNQSVIRRYITDLLEANLVEGIFIPPKGQLKFNMAGKIVKGR